MKQKRELHVIETTPGKYGCFNRPAQGECRYHHDDPMNRLDPKCMGCDHQMRPWREMGRNIMSGTLFHGVPEMERIRGEYGIINAPMGISEVPTGTYHDPIVAYRGHDRNGL